MGLLRARVHEALGETAQALSIYAELRDRYVGFEARYRYAVLLESLGREAEAHELYAFIVRHARRSALESEQAWVRLARQKSAVAA